MRLLRTKRVCAGYYELSYNGRTMAITHEPEISNDSWAVRKVHYNDGLIGLGDIESILYSKKDAVLGAAEYLGIPINN